MSALEESLLFQIRVSGLPPPEREYRFAVDQGRLWRFDFAWPVHRVAVEVEGGTWIGGRHNTGKGFAADCEKYNAAALAGWRVLRVTGAMVESHTALDLITRLLASPQEVPT